jgi:hypothetical protein
MSSTAGTFSSTRAITMVLLSKCLDVKPGSGLNSNAENSTKYKVLFGISPSLHIIPINLLSVIVFHQIVFLGSFILSNFNISSNAQQGSWDSFDCM